MQEMVRSGRRRQSDLPWGPRVGEALCSCWEGLSIQGDSAPWTTPLLPIAGTCLAPGSSPASPHQPERTRTALAMKAGVWAVNTDLNTLDLRSTFVV